MKNKGKHSAEKTIPYVLAVGLCTAALMQAAASALICNNLLSIEAVPVCGTIVFYASSILLLYALQRNNASISISLAGYFLYGIILVLAGWSFFNGDLKSTITIISCMAISILIFLSIETVTGRKQKKRIM